MSTLYRPESELVRQRLLEARHNAGMTQRVVADIWGVPQETISAIERGLRRIDVVELMDLCMILHLDMAKLVRELQEAWEAREAAGRRRKRPAGPSGKPRRRS